MNQTTLVDAPVLEREKARICDIIPHRPPFLFIDKVLEVLDEKIVTEYQVKPKDVEGHYPGNPLMPGVLLCELVFQAAAFFLGDRLSKEKDSEQVPVVSKILDARFRKTVAPGVLLRVEVQWEESSAGFHFFKGKVLNELGVVMSVRCVVALRAKGVREK